jgi:uncharacterized protein (TIGR02246 family)
MSIKNLLQSYEEALNATNTEKVMLLYSDNPVFMPQHAEAQVGYEQVKSAYNFVFSTIKLDVKFTIHEIEELGDTAWVRTTSKGKTTILKNGDVIDEGNNELFILKKIDGHWKIYRYLFATSTPQV